MVQTFVQPKRVYVWAESRTPSNTGRLGKLEKVEDLEVGWRKVVMIWRKIAKGWRKNFNGHIVEF